MKTFALLTSVLILQLVCELTTAHLCLISPVQRGSIVGINKSAADDCILLNSPCGGRPSKLSGIPFYEPNSNITVIFQKNLDHWAKATPGYFSVSFGTANGPESFKEVARVPDAGEPSLTLYAVNVTLPAMGGYHHHILQVTYVTKNPKAPPVFYQCSDIMLYG